MGVGKGMIMFKRTKLAPGVQLPVPPVAFLPVFYGSIAQVEKTQRRQENRLPVNLPGETPAVQFPLGPIIDDALVVTGEAGRAGIKRVPHFIHPVMGETAPEMIDRKAYQVIAVALY